MKDIFGNIKPIQIELNEWWFNGRIIVKQDDCRLPTWISFPDRENCNQVERHLSKNDAIAFAIKNPCEKPSFMPSSYIGLNNRGIS